MNWHGQALLDEYVKCGKNMAELSRRTGISRSTLWYRLKPLLGPDNSSTDEPPEPCSRARIDYEKGEGWVEYKGPKIPPLDELFESQGLDPEEWKIVEVMPNHWQGFYKKGERGDESHEVVDLYQIKVRIKRVAPSHVIGAAKTLAERIKPLARPTRKPRAFDNPKGQLLVWGFYDTHIGALAWEAETGENNNTNLAVERCKNATDDIIREVEPYDIEKVIVPVGNDLAHFDNFKIETSSGTHTMDSDSRYAKVVVACHDVLAYQIDALLMICDDIEIKLVEGNHDRDTALHMCFWLQQRYRNDPRVAVDVDLRSRKYCFWKGTLLGFMHGDKSKKEKGYRLMAEEARQWWAEAVCRELHTGHYHTRETSIQKSDVSLDGLTIRQNPSMAPPDYWTSIMGYNSIRCCDAFRYEPGVGFVGMHTCYVRTGR